MLHLAGVQRAAEDGALAVGETRRRRDVGPVRAVVQVPVEGRLAERGPGVAEGGAAAVTAVLAHARRSRLPARGAAHGGTDMNSA